MNSSAQTRYRSDIDGLRAVAILSVVAYHAGLPGIGGGFVGVDVFFVISGFLITRLLLDELTATGRIHFASFLARRVRRLLPAFAVMVLGTLALALMTVFPQELPRMAKSAMAAALISGNIHFLRFSGGYFDPSTDLMPMLHTWSLGVEEQYYLVWPPILAGTWWIARWRGGDGRRWLAGLFIALFLVSFLANVLMVGRYQASVFYLTPFRAWEFALGGGLNWATPRLARAGRPLGEALFLIGVTALVSAAVFLGDGMSYPGWPALLPTLGTGAAIAAGSVSAARWPRAVFGSRPMVAIGLVSYSWYLWHWPLLALGRAHELGERNLGRDTAIVLAALLLAWATYRFIEAPIRFRKPGGFRRVRETLLVGAGLIVAMLTMAGAVAEYGKWSAARIALATGQDDAENGSALSLCDLPPGGTSASSPNCPIGRPTVPPSILVWGDSHASQWLPLLAVDAKQRSARILVRSFPSCPPLLGVAPYKDRQVNTDCGKFNDDVWADALRRTATHQLKGVVLAARWNEYLARQETDPGAMAAIALADDWPALAEAPSGVAVGTAPFDHASSVAVESRGLRRTLEALTSLGLRVLVVAPVPELYFHARQCLYLRSPAQCVVPRERVVARRTAALAAIRGAAAGFPQVRVWDPIDEFCDENACYSQREGVVQYSDHNHVAAPKARGLEPTLRPHLRWLSGQD